MDFCHLSIQIVSRGSGKSAVAAAAYRAGETIKNEYDGIIHDYTKKGGIIHTEIMLPGHAPAEYQDRSVLWNAVEKTEKQCNSQLAREIEIALPAKLTHEQNISLVRGYVQDVFVSAGMCADICFHDKDDGNPHVHIMLTIRPINENGTWGAKIKKVNKKPIYTTDWNDRDKAEVWRAAFADYCNAALVANGFESTVDHRSYARQGLDIIPTVHLGPAASQMEKRGIRTERGDINRQVEITNAEIKQLRARINKLNKWIAEEAANTKPPTLYDIISNILSRQAQPGNSEISQSIYNVQAASQILIFLQNNKIADITDLEKMASTMSGKLISINEDRKKVQRRIGTLKKHLEQGEYIKDFRKVKRHYNDLYSEYESARKEKGFFAERKTRKALDAVNNYEDSYHRELTLYDAADRYMRDVLQDRYDPKKLPPLTMWKQELGTKTSENNALYREYTTLKDETAKVEKIQKSVIEIIEAETPRTESGRTPRKSRGMEL